jgi:hypothetical protein
LTKPQEVAKLVGSGKIRKNGWLIVDGALKSIELVKKSREKQVKLVSRFNKNFVVTLCGREFRENDIISKIKPIKRTINSKSYTIYPLRRCIWNKSAVNLFLIKSEDHKDFLPLFTTALKSKPETIITKYMERYFIEQTNKELKSYLKIASSYFKTKESNYGYIFITILTYNFIQYVRLKQGNMSFKDVLEIFSFYLLCKYPPKCVFQIENLFSNLFEDIDSNKINQLNIDL